MRHKGLVGWNYNARSNYMITLVTEPRQNLFGSLREWGVERSDAGRAVYDAWQEIERNFPGVRATYNMIMPDHFHGIVYKMDEDGVVLNDIVQFFAETAERRFGRKIWNSVWRDSICLAKGQLNNQIGYVLANARRRWVKEQNPELFRQAHGLRHWRLRRAAAACEAAGIADAWDFRAFARDPGDECWSLASGEEIVKPRKCNRVVSPFGGGGEEIGGRQRVGERQQAYDNKIGGEVGGVRQQAYDNKIGGGVGGVRQQAYGNKIDWGAMGNPFLLDAPLIVSTRISTTISAGQLDGVVEKIRRKVERGAVLASPFISPGERAARAAALEVGGSVVQLLAEGMGRYYKPAGRDFDLCVAGRLLQLSPFQPSSAGAGTREQYGKPRFEWLNLAAKNLADVSIDWTRERVF